MAKKVLALADDGWTNLDRDPASSTYVTDKKVMDFEKAMDWFRGLIADQEKKFE